MTDSFWEQSATLMESRLDRLPYGQPSWGNPRPILGGSLVAVVRSVAEHATGRHRRFCITTEQGATVEHEQILDLYRRQDFPTYC